MPFSIIAVILAILVPLAIAATFGLWLALLGHFGLPIILKRLRAPDNSVKGPMQLAISVMSWAGIVAMLLVYYLGLSDVNVNPWTLFISNGTTLAALHDWWFLTPLVWLALATIGPLVLLVHFGARPIFRLVDENLSGNQRITGIVTYVLLMIGVVVGLVGHGWPVWTAIVAPHRLWESTKLGHFLSPLLLPLGLVNLVLVTCLSGWLRTPDDRRGAIAKGILIAMLVAGLVGGVLSTLFFARG